MSSQAVGVFARMVLIVGLAGAVLAGCGGSANGPVHVGEGAGSTGGKLPDEEPDAGTDGGSDGGLDASSGADASGELDAGTDAALPLTCNDIECGLFGDCVMNETTMLPECKCDIGYEAVQDMGCVEDTDCIRMRAVECDSRFPSGAVGITISASYCSGRPYTSFTENDLTIEEKGGENYEAVEVKTSFPTVVPDRKFLSHIYFLVDASARVDKAVLAKVTDEIKRVFDALPASSATVSAPRVSVLAFDGAPYLYTIVPDTADFAAAKTQVAALTTFEGNDKNTSNLYGAVNMGLDRLNRAIEMRSLVNDDGVLSAGTLIVISNGDDDAGRVAFGTTSALLTDATNSKHTVITVGIAGAQTDFGKLTELGRDGSYAAPSAKLLTEAFDGITDSLDRFTSSLRFVGYCSPSRSGTFTAKISFKKSTAEAKFVTCTFDASLFKGVGCSKALFKSSICDGLECGDLLGCGECPSGECCIAGQCQAATTHGVGQACAAEWQCDSGLTCGVDGKCATPLDEGATCGGAVMGACNADEQSCRAADPGMPAVLSCLDVLPVVHAETIPIEYPDTSWACANNTQCGTGHCAAYANDIIYLNNYCLPAGRMYEKCSQPNSALGCERGTYCAGNGFCMPQFPRLYPCSIAAQCLSAKCTPSVGGGSYCEPETECFFPLAL